MRGDGNSYTANVDLPGLDGIGDVKAGQTFTGLDAGTAAYLVEKGDISPGKAPRIDPDSSTAHEVPAKDPQAMTRAEMLAELGADEDDEALREHVRRQRARKAEDDDKGDGGQRRERPKADTFEDLDEADRAEAQKLMRSSETKLRELAESEEVAGITSDSDKAQIARAIVAKRKAKAAEAGGGQSDTFDATAFVDRNLDDISDEDLAALSPEARAAVREAEDKREGGARSGLSERLDKLDAPAG